MKHISIQFFEFFSSPLSKTNCSIHLITETITHQILFYDNYCIPTPLVSQTRVTLVLLSAFFTGIAISFTFEKFMMRLELSSMVVKVTVFMSVVVVVAPEMRQIIWKDLKGWK